VTLLPVLTDARPFHHQTRTFRLAAMNANAQAGVALALRLGLPAAVFTDLLHGSRETVTVQVIALGSSGRGESTATIRSLTH